MIRSLTRPFRPVELGSGGLESFALLELAEQLRHQEEYARAGVAGLTLARGEDVTLVLVALRAGETMREHRAPSTATVVVLDGQVRFVSGPEAEGVPLGPGCLAACAADLSHAVEGVEDSVYLVVVGGRERPAHGDSA